MRKLIDDALSRGVPLLGAPDPRAPDRKQAQAMESLACRFASALLEEGMGLDAPDKRVMTRLLAMRACTKVIARLSKDAGVQTAAEVEHSTYFWQLAVWQALRDEDKAKAFFAQDVARATGANQ